VRLFAALELPPAVAEQVGERIEQERAALPAASWVRSANLHLTLAFFGDVDEARVEPLGAALAQVAAGLDPFAVHLGGAGGFPEHGAIRVVWLAIEPAQELARLSGRLRAAAEICGVASDAKPFRAHVTLARCRRPWPGRWRGALERLELAGASAIEVRSAALMASELGAGGPIYRRLAELPLGTGE